ncbi:TIGR03083 family protein [Brevibacterium aurantiacum]|uniref:TIGR03083 family protein n=2 Tax=Brevibacterium aurantiacum TaxID=273384 RepID=A0A2H1HSN8_BREAU|nr:TIGR03083 family protein [Brevibacterium aurantiacum]SMX70541.1 TIGR03083 family protein [Brevibacterium aurantiacum]
MSSHPDLRIRSMNPKKNTHPSAELIRDETFAERARVVDLLNGLDSHDWSAPSLCTGWRVREVVAHMTMAYRHRGLRFLLGLARRGFRFNDFADHLAHEDTNTLTNADLLAALRENIRNPWRPPGGGPVGALSHDVIHGLDITEPLGLASAPAERIRLVLEQAGEKNLAYFGTDLTGVRLIAEDAEFSMGTGPREVRASAREMLLTVTGRRPLRDQSPPRR